MPVIINKNDTTNSSSSRLDNDTTNFTSNQTDVYSKSIKNLEDTLPSKNDLSEINWAGSSYSGADIRIVVHLYGDVDHSDEVTIDKEAADLQSLADSYKSVASTSSNIVSNTTDSIFEIASDIAEPSAVRAISNFISIFNKYPRNTRASRMAVAAEANYKDYSATAEELRKQGENLEEVRKGAFSTFVLATAQTLSIQTHREKHPVRALGGANVKGFTRGPRTIAGSIIFTMFNEHALANLMRKMGSTKNKFDPSFQIEEDMSSLFSDQLPPLDLTILFANEYGSLSRGAIYGVEFMNSGFTLSIEDLLTEEVVNFVARDLDPIVSLGRVGTDRHQRGMYFNRKGVISSSSNLAFAHKDQYIKYLDRLKVNRGLRNR